MPSVVGTLVDNRHDLDSDYGQALADLPFDAYYIAGVDLAVPEAIIARHSAFVVTGTRWALVHGTAWDAVRGRAWSKVLGSAWPIIRRP
jgi:hypothetical protein